LPVAAIAAVSLALPVAASAAAPGTPAAHRGASQLTARGSTPSELSSHLRTLRSSGPATSRTARSDTAQLATAQEQVKRAQSGTVAEAVAPTTVPVFTSPTDGGTVSGSATFTATTTANTVHFFSTDVGSPYVTPSGGVATLEVDSYGIPDGPHTMSAADCDGGTCNTTKASINYTVDNGPVTVTQPTSGTSVGGTFVAQAASSGGRVAFLVDGNQVASVSAAPYMATVDTSGLSAGSHELTAVRCFTLQAACAGGTSAPVTFAVTKTTPVITSTKPSPFSPNGDGHLDTTTIGYRLDSAVKVTWRVTTRGGKTVRGPIRIGTVSAGQHAVTFNGKTNGGKYLTSGGYIVRFDTSKAIDGATLTGHAEHAVLVDTTAPKASRVHASPRTFYPAHDNYRDNTTITVHTSEATRSAQLRVLNAAGHQVAKITAKTSARGIRHLTWNGKTGGRMLPAGRYSYQVALTDQIWNTSVSKRYPVEISDKKLVRKSGTQTIGNLKRNHNKALIGGCSRIEYPARDGSAWKGSLSYLSNYAICFDPSDTELLAFTRHQVTLPPAVRYGTVRVTTYGGRSVPGFPDIGVVLYENKSGDITSKGGILKAADGWHAGSRVAGADFAQGHKLQWWAGTTDSNFYDIRSFRVSYSYYLLK
jgi:flagellar hook assembly protein FlgD